MEVLIREIKLQSRLENITLCVHHLKILSTVTVKYTVFYNCIFIDLDIRFQNSSYSVSESDPFLDVVVSLMVTLEREVKLDFVTTGIRASEGD